MSEEPQQRKFQRMLSLIDAYERSEISLGALIGDLEALLNLVVADAEWRQRFLARWGQLEDIESVRLYENRRNLRPEDDQKVVLALRALADLIGSVTRGDI